jgi:hypothetical protein
MKEREIEYQFVAVPLNLFCRLDNNLRSMLFVLIQLQTYYADKDGWFFRSNEDLKAQSNLSENLVRLTIDTLYKEGLIDVESVGRGKGRNTPSNRYKVLWERFKDYEKDDIEMCIKDPRLEIKTPQYKGSHYHPSYIDKKEMEVTTEAVMADAQVDDKVNDMVDDMVENVVKVEDNIYNIDNKENIDNKKNVDNIYNTKNIDNDNINNNFDYSIYKDWTTVRKTFPSEYDVSYLQIREMIFQLSQLTDYYSIKEKVSQLRRRLDKSKDKSLIEEALNVLDHKCDELSINIDTLFN